MTTATVIVLQISLKTIKKTKTSGIGGVSDLPKITLLHSDNLGSIKMG